MNLAPANHVFHFARLWNRSVENQATDRACRIGQTRNIPVHQFLCVGTPALFAKLMDEGPKNLPDFALFLDAFTVPQ